MKEGTRVGLAACGGAIALWAGAALLAPPGADLARHVGLTTAAWVVYLAAIGLALRLPAGHCRRDLAGIFFVAALLRVVLLGTTPSLSDDVYRAVWDARLVHAGINPYRYPPAAPELAAYRDDTIWPRVNHPHQHTPYPPGAELLGAAAYALLTERLVAMQALAAGMDLLGAGLLAWLLARVGADPRRCIVVAWSPLGALHFAHSGHNDAAMLAALLAGGVLLSYRRHWLAAVALGTGTAIKAVPVLALPAWLRAAGPAALLPWATTCALLTLPFLGAGGGLLAGALTEAGAERFNDSAYLVVERAVSRFAPDAATLAAAAVGTIAVVAAGAASWARGAPTAAGAVVGGSRVLATYLLVAPVVEPWYFTWLAPLVALRLQAGPGRAPFALSDAVAWLWLGGAALLTDLTYLPGGASLWPWIRLVEYGPAYGLLAVVAGRWWREQRRHAETPPGSARAGFL